MKMQLPMSLRTRFMIYVVILLVVLVGSIIFVIEKREVNAIFEEQKNKGILTAKNIAQLNLDPFLFWDNEGVKESIEKQIDEKLIYVIFYDRNNRPFTSNDFIMDYEEIYNHSNLPEVVERKSYFSERKTLKNRESGQVLRILEIETPIFAGDSDKRWGSIKIGLSLQEMLAEMHKTRLMLILIGCTGVLLGIVGAALLARRIIFPLKELVDGTVKISKGDFSQEIDINSQDEIGNLARSFNKMSNQLLLARKRMQEANRKLVQAEKLASIGRISAGIAHEIRNPLTSVKLNIQKLFGSEHLDKIEKDYLTISQEGIKQIENFIKEMLNFTRVSKLNINRFSMEQIINESVKMMVDSLELKKVLLEKDFQKGVPQVNVDGDKLRQVILNILHNACEAVDEGGRIRISLSYLKAESGGKVRIKISDDGIGILDKDFENIFEPFYTTKASGIGLGLANARKIIQQHNGSLKTVKKEGRGSSFEILIPCEGER